MFNRNRSVNGVAIEVACSQCIGCRVDRSRMWALRCVHEAKLYEDNCFVTLTYSNEYLPEGNTLVVEDLQKFMKRLRKHYEPRLIRFYGCGEYGEQLQRPHYHVCLFNLNFEDRKVWNKAPSGELQYRSATLEKLWPFGMSSVGTLTHQSAAYAARYIMQKQTGEGALEYAPHVDPKTGEVFGERVPPFNCMSRRPGIAAEWYAQFSGDVYPDDFCLLDGKKMKVPKFYDSLFERDGGDLEAVKRDRKERAKSRADDNTPDRLKVREIVHTASLNRLTRSVE